MLWSRRPTRPEVERFELVKAWEAACEGAGVARVISTVTGPTVVPPRVTRVEQHDGAAVLTVRLEPGQHVDDLRDAAPRIAPHLGAYGLRVEPMAHGAWCRVTLLPADPLASHAGATEAGGVPTRRGEVVTLLGHDEHAQPVRLDWTTAAHVVVQGATRSGKSTGLYGVLAQLADRDDVQVTGCDPTGLLLGPWATRTVAVAPSTGGHDPGAHVGVLRELVADMDARIAAIPAGRDAVDLDPDRPLLVVVLEEYPGLLRVLDGADKALGRAARASVARLLAEGAKAGVRVVLVAQRAEANVIGGFERGQASHALSYRVAGRDSVAMLHADAPADVVAAHATAEPGVALLSAPGVPLRRLRAPHVTYAEYVATVTGGRTA